MSNKLQEVKMKKKAILLAMLSIMAIWFSGCITGQTPSGDVKLTTGESQKFSVTGQNNGPYTWYWNSAPITGAAGTSYTYLAKSADVGTSPNTLRVETTDNTSGSALSVEWKVTVIEDLKPVAVISGPNPLDVTFDGVTPVALNGSSSFDPESESLTYIWEIVAQPSGSTAKILNPGDMITSFTPDKIGAYTIRLMVNDGRLNSIGAGLVVNAYTTNAPPSANAGADQNVLFGNTALLDGTASNDPESQPLTYQWTIDSGPSGTAATLDDPTKAKPIFTPDMKGMYVLSLVVNDGVNDSNTDWVVITVFSDAPIANAGAAIYVPDLGGTAQLDGSLSYDPDGRPLTYEWSLLSKPKGSTAALSSTTIVNPTLTCDKKGAYVAKLTVSNGDLSASDQVLITCSDQVPVADAGADISVPFLSTANLNGSASYDPDSDPITYAWSIVSAPSGSTAALSSTTIVNPTLTPDVRGVYEISLTVTDNDVPPISSAPDTVLVTVTNHPPVANAGADINVSIGGTANLFGSGSDFDSDALVGYAWTIVSAPYGSTAAISDPAIADPTFTPDLRGDYTIGLSVYDGMDWSVAVDTMQVHVFNNMPIAVAGDDQAVHYADRNNINLDGTASWDPDGDPIMGYRWEVVSKPAGSNPVLTNDLIAKPTLSIDKFGTYQVNLYVTDGNIESPPSTLTITTPYTSLYLNENFESGIGSWTSVNTGSITSAAISTYSNHSPTHCWSASSGAAGGCSGQTNTHRLHRALPAGTHVIKLSVWNAYRITTTSLGLTGGVSNQKFYTNTTALGSMFQSADQMTWVYNELELNQELTDIGLYVELFGMNFLGTASGLIYWDDLQITVWS
jgi:hypothetical protein